MFNSSTIQAILVCQGAEYQAVCRGLSRITGSTPFVIPIPVGVENTYTYLQKSQELNNILNHPQPTLLVMGLCGSLQPRYQVGDIVVYADCIYQENTGDTLVYECDATLTASLQQCLHQVAVVKALTSDHMIWSSTEKCQLGQMLAADVVDMEGYTVLKFFNSTGVTVGMVRVVSDGCDRDLPNLNSTLNSDGSLQPLSLAIAMLKQPIAATRLVRGALQGLQVLEEVTTCLFQP
ncbi:nucleoside phosphorylase [Fischerella sp. JS2]|uniref:5'-methylthioadenosine/S-adenosylhomocysteine nucleosidase family protein n=1 Tax=Fischerella sp. JS2 TaxID=2597771 RepID=UPI0028F0BC40|nr:nucleoside phosphorylase [Fischerella sp. JS2]